mmetsp:Transcript_74039/g.197365  ORF Transcript_74039/g.197365 Transcript_74039/m.197365 type:complete len:152 (-) Transcript_74039:1589-2044(-)
MELRYRRDCVNDTMNRSRTLLYIWTPIAIFSRLITPLFAMKRASPSPGFDAVFSVRTVLLAGTIIPVCFSSQRLASLTLLWSVRAYCLVTAGYELDFLDEDYTLVPLVYSHIFVDILNCLVLFLDSCGRSAFAVSSFPLSTSICSTQSRSV